jgi:hypothetical protein
MKNRVRGQERSMESECKSIAKKSSKVKEREG